MPGPVTAVLGSVARRLGLWVAFGLFERAGSALYDSAVLIDRTGTVRQVYRRIDPHWHRPDADPAVYRQGAELAVASTDFGTVTMLICGDLFSGDVLRRCAAARPDVVVVPMARGFDADVADDGQWQDREQAVYARQLQKTGAAGLVVNQLGGQDGQDATAGFGGALAIAADGTLLTAWPLHTEGLLLADVPAETPHSEGWDDQPGSTAGTAQQLRRSGMPVPGLTVVAEGGTARGERWSLKAGGSAQDYYTLMETIYPDGNRDEGGMGGPAIYPGNLLNIYTGRADQGPLRVIVRADRRVRRLRFRSGQGERCDLLPATDAPAVGVTLFAVLLLPWTTGIVSMRGLDADGQVVAPSPP